MVTAEFGEESISIEILLNLGKAHALAVSQRLPVEFRATDYKTFRMFCAGFERRIHRIDYDGAGNLITRLAGDDDTGASGQGLADRLISLASHDDAMSHGERLEMPEVGGQMPGKRIVDANDPVAGHGSDNREAGHAVREN